jgi:uncharacterized protein (TIGR03086 family)
MADLVELFDRAVHQFGARVAAVGDRWHGSTPDTEWDVHALVNHVLVENLWAPPLLGGSTIAEVGDRFDGDQAGDDALAAWARAAEASTVAVRQDGALACTVHVSSGDISGQEYITQLVCDQVIHGWDLARALGADERLDADLVDFALGYFLPQADAWRAAGVFGPKVDVPEGAGAQAELLALSGRQPAAPR